MLYDANFRLDESAERLQPLDFNVVELIRKNERGELHLVQKHGTIILRTVEPDEDPLHTKRYMSLPFGGTPDCFYCLSDPHNASYNPGGFLFHEEKLFFAAGLISLQHDYDGYRQSPVENWGNYATDETFIETVQHFQEAGIPLIRTEEDQRRYYDMKSWPDGKLPNLGEMSYEEAFEHVRQSRLHHPNT
mgnify:CR=1 FL=1|tara:strand:- start:96 stop:665 length:570 start_codon:yes stop_codon:yes gene_type:complete